MGKTHTTLNIDEYKRDLAKKLGINLSQALDSYLTALFAQKLQGAEVDLMKLSDEIADIQDQMADLQAKLDSKVSLRQSVLARREREQQSTLKETTKVCQAIKRSGFLEEL